MLGSRPLKSAADILSAHDDERTSALSSPRASSGRPPLRTSVSRRCPAYVPSSGLSIVSSSRSANATFSLESAEDAGDGGDEDEGGDEEESGDEGGNAEEGGDEGGREEGYKGGQR